MDLLPPDTRLEPLAGVEILAAGNGGAFVRVAGRAFPVPGLAATDLRRILEAVCRHGQVGAVLHELKGEYEEQEVSAVLESMTGRLWRIVEAVEPSSAGPRPRAAELRTLPALFAQPPRRRPTEDAPLRVCILGGGTAGYLAALTLAKKRPELEVTVIESREIPVIGVGEATTPLLPALLHGTLGLDMADFFHRVRPTWKLGIHFRWGHREPGYFHYPFVAGRLAESWVYEGHINAYSLPSLLMEARRSGFWQSEDGTLSPLPGPFGYHLDNARFVAYLRQEAAAAGIRHLDRRVVDADVVQDGDEPRVLALRSAEGERLAFDFFLDCSGFASFLLGRVLRTPFLSYDRSLFTDSALAAEHPHGGSIEPFTTATTRDHGWMWTVPQPESDHCGYVFSSAHTSPEQAQYEMRRALPGLGEARLLRFRCGRHEDFWRGNVAALGNAYGFVEPLESTALHMVVLALTTLVRHLPSRSAPEPAHRLRLNRQLGVQWDALRDFLALHFQLNRARDTPFWRRCREETELGKAEEILALFRERGPLSLRPKVSGTDDLWGDFGRDVLLLGQGVEAPPPRPALARPDWERLLARGRALAATALPQEQALAALAAQPEVLRRWQRTSPWLKDEAVGGAAGW